MKYVFDLWSHNLTDSYKVNSILIWNSHVFVYTNIENYKNWNFAYIYFCFRKIEERWTRYQKSRLIIKNIKNLFMLVNIITFFVANHVTKMNRNINTQTYRNTLYFGKKKTKVQGTNILPWDLSATQRSCRASGSYAWIEAIMQDNKMVMKILEFIMVQKGEELYDYSLISRKEARGTYRTWTIVSIDKSQVICLRKHTKFHLSLPN